MTPPRHIGRFFLLVAGYYALLMAPWPGIEAAYAAFFRTGGNIVFARFWIWTDGSVRFLDLRNLQPGDLAPGTPPMQADHVRDTVMELRARSAPGSIGYLRTGSRYIAYVPSVVVMALILATPLPWKRRAWSLCWGLLLVHLFVALRLTLTLAAGGFAADKPYALFDPSPLARDVLSRAASVVSDDPTVSFVVPALIWFVTALMGHARSEPVVNAKIESKPDPTLPRRRRRRHRR